MTISELLQYCMAKPGAEQSVHNDWKATQIDFYVDDALATSLAATLNNPMGAWISVGPTGHPLAADWARVLQYPVTSGTYTSTFLDAGSSTTWQTLAWTGTLPASTSLTPQTRTSVDGTTWSAYQALGSGGAIASPAGRYLQYQLGFSGTTTASPLVGTVTVAFGGAGSGSARVQNSAPAQQKPAPANALVHPPTITTISPASGPPTGGTTVTITGTGFGAGARVIFGEAPATNVKVISANEITVTVPAAAKPGAVDVTVFVGTEGAALAHGYTYGTNSSPPAGSPPASSPPANLPTPRVPGPTGASTGTTPVVPIPAGR